MSSAHRCRSGLAILSAFVLFERLASAQSSVQPQVFPWNKDGGHGPDGPWNYITLNVGSQPTSQVDFYPIFGSGQSFLIRSDDCTTNKDACIQPSPNYYNGASQSAQNPDQAINASTAPVTGLQQHWQGEGYFWTDTITDSTNSVGGSDIALFVLPNVTQSYNDKSYVPMNFLSMEPTTMNNPVKTTNSENATQNTILEEYVNGTGGSKTMTLHMGLAGFNQPGSLIFGGYDRSRLIERPAVFTELGAVALASLTFGSAAGQSPWMHTLANQTNFLGSTTNVLLSPHVATIQLPNLVCNFMAQYLPLTKDEHTGLFLWNTSSPSYHEIMSSPSYLNFTFGDGFSTSIKVPFAALNLNLTAPLKDQPTPYFPCEGRSDTTNLGRAFLQSAFLMQAWGENPLIYVGQAPGPMATSVTSNPTPITLPQGNPDVEPAQDAPKWIDTWSNLKALESASTITPSAAPLAASSSATASDSPSGGLSGGAIAGAVIGVLLGVAVIAGAVSFFRLRRRRFVRDAQAAAAAQQQHGTPAPYGGHDAAFYGAQQPMGGKHNLYSPVTPATARSGGTELPAYQMREAQELDSGRRYEELDAERVYFEMGDPQRTVTHEMPASNGLVEMNAGPTARR